MRLNCISRRGDHCKRFSLFRDAQSATEPPYLKSSSLGAAVISTCQFNDFPDCLPICTTMSPAHNWNTEEELWNKGFFWGTIIHAEWITHCYTESWLWWLWNGRKTVRISRLNRLTDLLQCSTWHAPNPSVECHH